MEARRAWHFFKTYSVIKDSAQNEELPRRLGFEGEGLINPVGSDVVGVCLQGTGKQQKGFLSDTDDKCLSRGLLSIITTCR